jgi:hypothetical protein
MTYSEVVPWATQTKLESEKVPATEILAELPNQKCTEREQMVLNHVLQGNVPSWFQRWCVVPVRNGQDGLSGEFYCSPDFLCVGRDDDWVRVRINPVTAELIGEHAGAVLPTRKMVKVIYAHSRMVEAQTWGEDFHKKWDYEKKGNCYGASMMYTARWRPHDQMIAEAMGTVRQDEDVLYAGHMKNMVVGAGLSKKAGATVGIYGWFRKDGSVIQGESINFGSHEWEYTDYSHGFRLIHEDMMVNSISMNVREVLKDPELASLICDEGALKHVSYREFHPDYLQG